MKKKNNKYIKYANCKKEKEVIYRLPNHNECNNKKKTRPQKYFYIVCSAEKCFDKFRLKESQIEMAKLILKLILKRFMKSIKLEEF